MPREQLNALLAVFEKSARALHAAHQAGILHRDIKPGNIMVIKEGEPVILDFGLARDESADVSLTHPGDVFGTPAYMSPEQIAGQCVRLDARSDVYSLGVTLYECLTIVRPFDAATRESLYQAVMTKEPPDPRRFNRSIRGLPAATRSQCCLRDSNGKFGSLPRGCGRRSMGTALEFS
jgi:serine/threonine protein kinase